MTIHSTYESAAACSPILYRLYAPLRCWFISFLHVVPYLYMRSTTTANDKSQMLTTVMTQPFPMLSNHGIVAKEAAKAIVLRHRLLIATPEADRPGINSVSMVVETDMSRKLANPRSKHGASWKFV